MTGMKCLICGTDTFSSGICPGCSRKDEVQEISQIIHRNIRKKYDLPPFPPSDGKITCTICSSNCKFLEGTRGYCGLRKFKEGKFVRRSGKRYGTLYMYLDPLPTNCCASWFCSGSEEKGRYNLAVFFYGCNFDCLFCQNYNHKNITEGKIIHDDEFVQMVENNRNIECVCFFGGSPEPHLPFALNVSRRIIEEVDRNVRICWEWNGAGNRKLVKKAGELSIESGGIIKFDLKAWNRNLHIFLTGKDNTEVLKNFEMLAVECGSPENLLTATTLLVPFYVTREEVEEIAKFISSFSRDIPYSLLVFHPQFYMSDLPVTPVEQVRKCHDIARKYLKKVNIGNMHLIGYHY